MRTLDPNWQTVGEATARTLANLAAKQRDKFRRDCAEGGIVSRATSQPAEAQHAATQS